MSEIPGRGPLSKRKRGAGRGRVHPGLALGEGGPAARHLHGQPEAGVVAAAGGREGGPRRQPAHGVPGGLRRQVQAGGGDQAVALGDGDHPVAEVVLEALAVHVEVGGAIVRGASVVDAHPGAVPGSQGRAGGDPEQVPLAPEGGLGAVDRDRGDPEPGVEGEEQRVEGLVMGIEEVHRGGRLQLPAPVLHLDLAGEGLGRRLPGRGAAQGDQVLAVLADGETVLEVGLPRPHGAPEAGRGHDRRRGVGRERLAQPAHEQRRRGHEAQAREQVGAAHPHQLLLVAEADELRPGHGDPEAEGVEELEPALARVDRRRRQTEHQHQHHRLAAHQGDQQAGHPAGEGQGRQGAEQWQQQVRLPGEGGVGEEPVVEAHHGEDGRHQTARGQADPQHLGGHVPGVGEGVGQHRLGAVEPAVALDPLGRQQRRHQAEVEVEEADGGEGQGPGEGAEGEGGAAEGGR